MDNRFQFAHFLWAIDISFCINQLSKCRCSKLGKIVNSIKLFFQFFVLEGMAAMILSGAPLPAPIFMGRATT